MAAAVGVAYPRHTCGLADEEDARGPPSMVDNAMGAVSQGQVMKQIHFRIHHETFQGLHVRQCRYEHVSAPDEVQFDV